MRTQTFTPNPKYMTKMRIVMTVVALAIMVGCFLIGTIISLDRRAGAGTFILMGFIVFAINAAWWLPGMFLADPYYRSLNYEIQDDEVIVRAGIWTKSVKHVPYRTVTNLTIKRDILDRMLGLGTLNIQTAGMSGQTGAEESLVALTDVQEVYDLVATELRRFRGAMAPTQAEVEAGPAPDTLDAILAEVRAIRQALDAQA